MLSKFLRGRPPFFEVRDDAEVLVILAELGIPQFAADWEVMADQAGGGLAAGGVRANDPPSAGGRLVVVGYSEHPAYWIVVLRYSGWARAEDNGWMLSGFDKARFTQAQVTAQVGLVCEREPEFLRWLPLQPAKRH